MLSHRSPAQLLLSCRGHPGSRSSLRSRRVACIAIPAHSLVLRAAVVAGPERDSSRRGGLSASRQVEAENPRSGHRMKCRPDVSGKVQRWNKRCPIESSNHHSHEIRKGQKRSRKMRALSKENACISDIERHSPPLRTCPAPFPPNRAAWPRSDSAPWRSRRDPVTGNACGSRSRTWSKAEPHT